jgi:hypothetical protein
MEKYDREQGGLSNHPQISYVQNQLQKKNINLHELSQHKAAKQLSRQKRAISALIPKIVSTVHTKKTSTYWTKESQ